MKAAERMNAERKAEERMKAQRSAMIALELQRLAADAGQSKQAIADACGISRNTVRTTMNTGNGHHVRRIREYLESVSAGAASASGLPDQVRAVVRDTDTGGGPPLHVKIMEFARQLEGLPRSVQIERVRGFLRAFELLVGGGEGE